MTARAPHVEHVLCPGIGVGAVLALDEPLSFWGGLDPATGTLIDPRHPQVGASLTGTVLAMPAGRGSSSSTSVLAEAIRAGTAPVAIVLGERDAIVALGAIVADELYGVRTPVVVVDDLGALSTGDHATVSADADGATVTVRAPDG